MRNADLQAAWDYHNGTKHSYLSVRTNPHFLDWENQPLPFKIYPKLDPIPLPEPRGSSKMAALLAVSARVSGPTGESVPGIQTIADIFYFSAGIMKRKRYPGGEMFFRAAACTGALYHIDLYLVCADLPGL